MFLKIVVLPISEVKKEVQLDFIQASWFKKLWPLLMARYSLREDQAKVLTAAVAIGRRINVNEIKEMLEHFKGSCDRSRADTVAESLRAKGLFRKSSARSHKYYKALPYEDLWPEIEDSYTFICDCKAILQQNQKKIDFNKEIQEEDIATFEKEHDLVSYMREVSRSRTHFVILRTQLQRNEMHVRLWQIINKRLEDINRNGGIEYITSKINAILLLQKKKPIGFIRLKKRVSQQETRFHGIKILDAELANIIYKNEAQKERN